MIHFRPKQWHIGDVHPFCHDGRVYVYYLVPNGTLRCDACFTNPEHVVCRDGSVAVTSDFITWEEHPLAHPVINVLPWREGFLSCCGDVICESSDLLHWRDCAGLTSLPRESFFPGGIRDQSLFYDTDLKALRQTATAYNTNEHHGRGQGMDCGVMLTGPLSDQPCTQRMLLRLSNPGRPLYACLEPECSQLLRMGSRWALLTSLARQSVHWVGAPSVYLGQPDTPIDAQDWNRIQPVLLDGEDLCAAQLTPWGDRWLLFGWIPLNYRDQEWGGDLNLPREVYLLPDGRLGSRLEPAFAQRIQGEMCAEPLRPSASEDFGMAAYAQRRRRNFGIHADFAPTRNGTQGVIIDGDNGIVAELDRAARTLQILSRGDGREPFVFASLTLDDGADGQPLHIHALYDEDIVEVFVNDRYALCARVNVRCRESRCGMFAPDARQLLSLNTYDFRADAAVYTPGI